MSSTDRLPILDDLTDELLVVSALLDMLATPHESAASVLEMCAASAERCQKMVGKLLRMEGPPVY
jgi:hypothetical protein